MFRRKLRHPGGVVHHLRNGDYKGIKAGELEVRTHKGPDDLTTIYVRIPSSNRRRSAGEP